MSTKFTPGPWSACNEGKCKCKIISSNEDHVCTVISGEWGDTWPALRLVGDGRFDMKAEAYIETDAYGSIPEEVAIANARLIASAPDLLAALKKIVEMNRQTAEDQYGDANKAEGWACVTTARAAIAKAEGR